MPRLHEQKRERESSFNQKTLKHKIHDLLDDDLMQNLDVKGVKHPSFHCILCNWIEREFAVTLTIDPLSTYLGWHGPFIFLFDSNYFHFILFLLNSKRKL